MWFEANAEAWLESIAEHTPRTIMLGLSDRERRALLGACERAGEEAPSREEGVEATRADVDQDADTLRTLARRLEPAVATFVCSSGGAFVKTSCRSPKG